MFNDYYLEYIYMYYYFLYSYCKNRIGILVCYLRIFFFFFIEDSNEVLVDVFKIV